MAGTIERIERDIAALDQAVAAIAEEFHSTYSGYLTTLGQAARQQLIMAAYHLCTQGYPEKFLALSFNQRRQLQQEIRRFSHALDTQLNARLHLPTEPAPTPPSAPESSPPPSSEVIEPLQLLDEVAEPGATQPQKLTPEVLAKWQESLEAAIVDELRTTSHAVNRLLQQNSVLPKRLPEPILEAAAKIDPTETVAGPPNLLNLTIEAISEGPPEKFSSEEMPPIPIRKIPAVHIIAVHLRLAEIEFTDPMVMNWRSKLRTLLNRLNTLGRDYQKKQRERAIAEAEAAWRTSWFED